MIYSKNSVRPRRRSGSHTDYDTYTLDELREVVSHIWGNSNNTYTTSDPDENGYVTVTLNWDTTDEQETI